MVTHAQAMHVLYVHLLENRLQELYSGIMVQLINRGEEYRLENHFEIEMEHFQTSCTSAAAEDTRTQHQLTPVEGQPAGGDVRSVK